MVVPIFVDLAFEDACFVPAPSEVVFLAQPFSEEVLRRFYRVE